MNKTRKLQSFEDDESQAQYLGFKPVLVNFTGNNMTIQLMFNKFENVSSTNFGEDVLRIKIKTFKYFVSESGKTLDRHALLNNLTTIYKSLPTMTADRKTGETIKDTMKKVKLFVNSALTSNAVLSPVISFAMQ